MAILRVEEIRKMDKEGRQKKLNELKAEMSKLMSSRAMGGSMENPARIGLIRKTIAQFYTIEREEELGIRKPQPPKESKAKEKEKEKQKKEKEKAPVEKAVKPKAPQKRARATVDEEDKAVVEE